MLLTDWSIAGLQLHKGSRRPTIERCRRSHHREGLVGSVTRCDSFERTHRKEWWRNGEGLTVPWHLNAEEWSAVYLTHVMDLITAVLLVNVSQLQRHSEYNEGFLLKGTWFKPRWSIEFPLLLFTEHRSAMSSIDPTTLNWSSNKSWCPDQNSAITNYEQVSKQIF